MNRTQKRLLRTLRLLAFAPFVAGFITGMVVFTEAGGMTLVGLVGMVGIWMIAATAAYQALKHYVIPPEQ